jgi:hypothetical protein
MGISTYSLIRGVIWDDKPEYHDAQLHCQPEQCLPSHKLGDATSLCPAYNNRGSRLECRLLDLLFVASSLIDFAEVFEHCALIDALTPVLVATAECATRPLRTCQLHRSIEALATIDVENRQEVAE